MKRIIIVVLVMCFAFGLAPSVSYAFWGQKSAPRAETVEGDIPAAVPAAMGPKKLVAVAEFENKTNWQGQVNLGTGMADQLITSLMNTERYMVLERDNIEAVLREQDFGASGRTTKEGGAKIGKISRAQILIQGAVTEFGHQGGGGGGFNIKGFAFGGSGESAVVGIDLRIYDTTTGEVLASKACRGVAKASGSNIGYLDRDWGFSMGGEDRTPMDFAVRAAIQQAVNFITAEIDRVPWEGRIAMIKGGMIYINAGRKSGIKIGDQFIVFREGEKVIDPESGIELGSEISRIGEIEVVSVQEKFAKAAPLKGTLFEQNDVIKFE